MNPITFSKTQSKFPYFNDYDIEKNFYKILFKPSNEIQVRELNQLQTIFKEQFARFANHVFSNGSLVFGCDHLINTTAIAYTIEFLREPLDLKFESYFVLSKDKERFGQLLFNPFQIAKKEWICIVNILSKDSFINYDKCYITSDLKTPSNINFEIKFNNPCSFIKFNSGIIYLNGVFIFVNEQKILLSENSKEFSGSIGFKIEKFIETNEFKPDLEKINLILSKQEIFNDDKTFAEQLVTENFIEFLRVKNGVLLKNVTTPIFSNLEKTLARRTYDESGSYTVTPFSVKIKNSETNINNFTLEISPGKAYVLGYEFDSITTRYLEIPRALDTQVKENFEISTYYGNFIILESFSGYFNVQECEQIDLLDKPLLAISFIPGGNYLESKIGIARVRFVRFLETQLHLYLFDIQTIENKTFEKVESICSSNNLSVSRGKGNIHGISKIYEKDESGLLFKLPEEMIKTLKSENNSFSSDYTYQKSFTNCLFENSDTPGSSELEVVTILENIKNERFITSPDNFIIVSRTDGSFFNPEQVISLIADNTLVSLKVTKPSFIGDVYALVNVNFGSEISKNKEITTIDNIELNSLIKNQFINLNALDVIKLISCFINGFENVKNFVLFSEKYQDSYKTSKIQYIGEDILTPIKIKIIFEKFSRLKQGYFTCDSYDNYDDIIDETYNKNVFKLRNIIDFRPDNNLGVIKNAKIPIPDGTFECSYYYYLSRKDKLIVTSAKTFEIIQGISSDKPILPLDKKDALLLYSFDIPAYSSDPKDINVKFYENKRYTMRDIGKLETRIEKIEYYTALSLLEKDTKDMEILDENGNSRFKNGFLVDNFKTFKSIDSISKENQCALDNSNSVLRPSFEMFNHDLMYNPYESTTRRAGDLITIPFTEVTFVEQSKVTESMSLQPFEVFTWQGTVDLLPENDEWVDTETKPEITANQFGSTDIWSEIGTKAFTAQWGSWEKNILSVPETQNATSVKYVSPSEIPTESVKKLWTPSVDSTLDVSLISAYYDWVAYLERLEIWKTVKPSPTPSPIPTTTPTPSETPTKTPPPSAPPSQTPTNTPTISITPSITPTISITPSITPTISNTPFPPLINHYVVFDGEYSFENINTLIGLSGTLYIYSKIPYKLKNVGALETTFECGYGNEQPSGYSSVTFTDFDILGISINNNTGKFIAIVGTKSPFAGETVEFTKTSFDGEASPFQILKEPPLINHYVVFDGEYSFENINTLIGLSGTLYIYSKIPYKLKNVGALETTFECGYGNEQPSGYSSVTFTDFDILGISINNNTGKFIAIVGTKSPFAGETVEFTKTSF